MCVAVFIDQRAKSFDFSFRLCKMSIVFLCFMGMSMYSISNSVGLCGSQDSQPIGPNLKDSWCLWSAVMFLLRHLLASFNWLYHTEQLYEWKQLISRKPFSYFLVLVDSVHISFWSIEISGYCYNFNDLRILFRRGCFIIFKGIISYKVDTTEKDLWFFLILAFWIRCCTSWLCTIWPVSLKYALVKLSICF